MGWWSFYFSFLLSVIGYHLVMLVKQWNMGYWGFTKPFTTDSKLTICPSFSLGLFY